MGRREELNLLLDTLTRVRRERSVQLLTLTGVPGIGKSRLVWELLTALEREPALVAWHRGRCLPYGEGVSFWALGEIVKSEAEILETDDSGEVEEKLARVVRRLLPEPDAAWVEDHLKPLVGLGREAAQLGERREESFAAWRRFLEGLAERDLAILVFEDLHWADDGLLDFVDYLADWAQGVPLLLIGTARPELLERRPAWSGGKRNAATIALSPLSEDETSRLIGFLLRRARLPERLRDALLSRAEGNPLYAEEYARMLADRGLLRDGAGPDLAEADLSLPESIQGIIASRLDTLPAEQKALLQDASVVGKGFWAGALAHMAEREQGALAEPLHVLERKEFVRGRRDSAVVGEQEYTFVHALVRDVAYAQIPRAQRARKHCLAAEWIEALGRPDDHAEMLAHHYLSALEFARAAGQETGEFADRARVALREAGDRALALNSFSNASRFYQGALDLTADSDSEQPKLLLRLGRARFEASAEGVDELTAARDGLLAQGDAETAAEAEVMLYSLCSARGEGDRADEHIRRAAELVEDASPSASKAYVLHMVASRHLQSGDDESAARVAREAAAIAEGLGLDELRAGALATAGAARFALDDGEGLADLEDSIRITEHLGTPAAVLAHTRLAAIMEETGDLRRRAELHARARELALRFGVRRYIRWLEGERVGELYWEAKWADALSAADAFIAVSGAGAPHYLESFCRVMRGRIRLAQAGPAEATDDAERAVELARAARDPQVLHPALALAGRVAAEAGDADAADALLNELLELGRTQAGVYPLALADAAALLAARGRSEPVAGGRRSRWLEAASALTSGDAKGAAAVYDAIGSLPDAAYARLLAAETAAAEGRRGEAEGELERALAFFRSVEASAYARRAESLLAPSA